MYCLLGVIIFLVVTGQQSAVQYDGFEKAKSCEDWLDVRCPLGNDETAECREAAIESCMSAEINLGGRKNNVAR